MVLIIMLGLGALALKFARLAAILLVDAFATSLAALYYWRSERLVRAVSAIRSRGNAIETKPAWTASRSHRRLLASHLRLSIAMTAHFSLFPVPSRRGYAIARALIAKAA